MFTKLFNLAGWMFYNLVKIGALVAFIVVAIFGFWFTGKINQPMTIPQAKQYLPGVTFAQLWLDREDQYGKIDQKWWEDGKKKIAQTKNPDWVQLYVAPIASNIKFCMIYNPISQIPWLLYAPYEGYTAIYREDLKYIPNKGDVAPIGMFPNPDKAVFNDYLDSAWYSFQEKWWWFNVDNTMTGCHIPHPAQTMKTQIAEVKKK